MFPTNHSNQMFGMFESSDNRSRFIMMLCFAVVIGFTQLLSFLEVAISSLK